MRRTIILTTLACCFILSALAQSGTVLFSRYPSTLTSLGYAPGQIVTMEVAGLKAISTLPYTQAAPSLPLPSSLAGISATVNQSLVPDMFSAPQPMSSTAAAVVAIWQEAGCSDVVTPPFPPECVITFITLQIPFELKFNPVGYPQYLSYIVFSQDGVDGHSFAFNLAYDSIHIITVCDQASNPTVPNTSCSRIVTHADGTPVSAKSPANPGEVLVIYAWGLGWTVPSVPTGGITPASAPTVNSPGWNGVQVRFDFTVDAAPSERTDIQLPTIPAYLTPGQVGLYQINVQLPASFPDVPPCSTTDAAGVRSNLTIDLNGAFSYDGAPICVQPPAVN
jgi:uncharacterized protein (TIGR03437 family)